MGNGAEYIRTSFKTDMSPLGEEVADLLDTLYGGIYHLAGPGLGRVDWTNPNWIEYMLVDHRSANLHTYDFDDLTWLVLLSHDRCLRVELRPGNFRCVKLMFHVHIQGHADDGRAYREAPQAR